MSTASLSMTCPPEVYQKRRAKVAAGLKRAMILPAGRAPARNYVANPYPFRAGSTYLYFGGPPLEGAALLIEPGSDGQDGCTLFRVPSDFDDAVWFGEQVSDEKIAAAASVKPGSLRHPDDLSGALSGRPACAFCPPCHVTLEWMRSLDVPEPNPDELLLIVEMRLYKDEHELTAMRHAAKVGMDGHLAVMKAAKPGKTEADMVAAIESVYTANHCRVSFNPIITVHGEVLHTHDYTHPLKSGDLLLVDSGAEEPGGYASDITRTMPVNGEFTPIQRRLHDTVFRTMRKCCDACVPGKRYREIHDLAGEIICEGLVDAELLRGDPPELAGRLAHTLFFSHGVGHLLGLDVHDLEDFGDLAGYPAGRNRRTEFGNKFLRLDRDLQPGMVVTIEPGIYFVPAIWERDDLIAPFKDVVNRPAIDALLKENFGGIRIEDDVVVRASDADGPEVLSEELAASPDQVMAIMAGT